MRASGLKSSIVLANCFALCVALLATLLLAPRALAQSATFATSARQAILMDYDSGSVLYQKNADELMPPASMSKLMTLAVVFKAMKAGQLKPEDKFTMSVNAWRKGGAPSGTSAMFVPVNTQATLEELIQGIIVQSGNDAAMAIAEGMAGSEAAFAKIMTAEARRIGLKKSVFRNSTGLYHPEHMMTARELALLARHIIKEYPSQYPIFAQREFRYRKHRFYNRNPLLSLDIGVDGLKTGYVGKAGYGIVVSAKQGKRRLIGVLNGMATRSDRKAEARKLIEWGYRNFGEFRLFDPDEVVTHARVWGGESMYVPLIGRDGVVVALPKFPANQRLRAELVYKSPLKPPIAKGDEVARLRITSSTSAVSEAPLFAKDDVKKAGIFWQGIDSAIFLAFGWLP